MNVAVGVAVAVGVNVAVAVGVTVGVNVAVGVAVGVGLPQPPLVTLISTEVVVLEPIVSTYGYRFITYISPSWE